MDTTKSEVYLTMDKDTLVKIIDNKRECIKMLKQRIDKAIEYIEDNVSVYAFNDKRLPHWEMNDDEIKELLDILKGNDKE